MDLLEASLAVHGFEGLADLIPEVESPAALTEPPPDTGLDPEANGFVAALDTLAQAMRRARGASPYDRDLLTISQLSLLSPLWEGRVARVSDLACAASISPSTATRILDALERRGVVRRARSREDRRGVTVTLTPLGREVLAGQQAWVRARKLRFYGDLDRAEQAVVSDVLIRLAGLVDELAAGPPSPASP
jgi:DNA-binding MarR family transcriptional regulator